MPDPFINLVKYSQRQGPSSMYACEGMVTETGRGVGVWGVKSVMGGCPGIKASV